MYATNTALRLWSLHADNDCQTRKSGVGLNVNVNTGYEYYIYHAHSMQTIEKSSMNIIIIVSHKCVIIIIVKLACRYELRNMI